MVRLVGWQQARDESVYLTAKSIGCQPVWHDGIYGWAWHCGCEGNPHGIDQQCSVITLASLLRNEEPKP